MSTPTIFKANFSDPMGKVFEIDSISLANGRSLASPVSAKPQPVGDVAAIILSDAKLINELYIYMTNTTSFHTVKLLVLKGAIHYLTYSLKSCIITGVQLGSVGPSNKPIEATFF